MAKQGRIISATGGLYTVISDTETILCHAKGSFRKQGISPLVGDLVLFQQEETPPSQDYKDTRALITQILERKNALIRPPLANLDTLFIVSAVCAPEPILITIDKLLSIAVHNKIHPVLVFTKKELAPEKAEELCALYRKAGFDAVAVSKLESEETRKSIFPFIQGEICAVAGASGVGKSTLINTLFPSLSAETGAISEKNMRGKHTTRQCTLYDISPILQQKTPIYMADTPGFSLLDFQHFFFMEKEDLFFSFPEFLPHLGNCKYTKCSHRTEDGCRILEEIKQGNISPSRHESYLILYEELSRTKAWDSGKKKTKR